MYIPSDGSKRARVILDETNSLKKKRLLGGGWTRSRGSLGKSLLEDLSSGRQAGSISPPSASGAGGIMRQRAWCVHSNIYASESFRSGPQEHFVCLCLYFSASSPSITLFLSLSITLPHSLTPSLSFILRYTGSPQSWLTPDSAEQHVLYRHPLSHRWCCCCCCSAPPMLPGCWRFK